jgi:arylsulfatase A-like enzyme
MDSIVVQLALTGMRAYDLGGDDHTDLLAISFSTFDAIGHHFGPDSREIHDELLRLDGVIGALMDSIYARVDSTRVIFALSADHGVTRFPELMLKDTAAIRQAYVDMRPALAAFRAAVAPHGIKSGEVRLSGGRLDIDAAALRRTGYDPSPEVEVFLKAARGIPGVLKATTVADLAKGDSINDTHTRRWLHMLPPDANAVAVVSVKPGHVWGTAREGKHGTSTDDDAFVPIIFKGTPFKPGRYATFTRTADIAPTLAAAIGVNPTEPLDGRVLTAALRP